MTTLAVISAGLSTPSSTRMLADRLANATVTQLGGDDVQLRVIELRELAHPLADRMLTGFASDELQRAIDTVVDADGVIVVTPVFASSYAGLFKMFIDALEPRSLRGKPVLLGATGGSARHSLVLEYALRPLFGYLGALPAPTGVFAATADWGDTAAEGGLSSRIARAATDFAQLLGAKAPADRGAGGAVAAADRDWGSDEGFADPVEFSSLLDRVRR